MSERTEADVRRAKPVPMPSARFVRAGAVVIALVAAYWFCWRFAEVDPGRLIHGLPRLWSWTLRAWPPDFSDLGTLLERAAETLAMATLGTTLGGIIAVPVCFLAAASTAPNRLIYGLARVSLNALRGIDSFVFALLFVAAVGLGPFAGVLGIAVHSAGSIAKLWSEAVETAADGPLEAAMLSGASKPKVLVFALLPDVLPSLVSTLLYVWEFNVRASTVLGIVGAGGIGQELKNNIDLLAFPRVLAILLVILAMVTIIDRSSAWLRGRLS